MKKRIILALCILFLVIFHFSCGALGFIGHKPPVIKVSKISPKNLSMQGFDLHLTLEIDNKSPGYITFTKAETNVHVEGKAFSKVEFQKEIQIEAEKKSYITIKIPMTWIKIHELAGNYLDKEYISVFIKGKAYFSEKFKIYLGYEVSLKVPAIKIVPVVDSFKIESLKFNRGNILRGNFDAEARCRLNFSLINYSKKILTIKRMRVIVFLAGEKIVENVEITPLSSDSRKTSYSLVMSLRPSKILVNVLRGNELKLQIGGSLDLESKNELFSVKNFKLTLSDFITLINR